MTSTLQYKFARILLVLAAATAILIGATAARLSAQKSGERPSVPVASAASGRLPTGQMVTPPDGKSSFPN